MEQTTERLVDQTARSKSGTPAQIGDARYSFGRDRKKDAWSGEVGSEVAGFGHERCASGHPWPGLLFLGLCERAGLLEP